LGAWVNKQRQRREGMLAERRARLDALGFTLDPHTAHWEEGFQHLQVYANEHGHCRVPYGHVTANGYRLGQWVQSQRNKKASISAERKARLDALGFVWDVLAKHWEEGFQHLQVYAKEHGHCRVPATYVAASGYRLGQWVKVQRRGEKKMPAERKARLDALGFEWAPKKRPKRRRKQSD
jgi:helicase associated protein